MTFKYTIIIIEIIFFLSLVSLICHHVRKFVEEIFLCFIDFNGHRTFRSLNNRGIEKDKGQGICW